MQRQPDAGMSSQHVHRAHHLASGVTGVATSTDGKFKQRSAENKIFVDAVNDPAFVDVE